MRDRRVLVLVSALVMVGCSGKKEDVATNYTPPDTTFSGGKDAPRTEPDSPDATNPDASNPTKPGPSTPDAGPKKDIPTIPEPPKVNVKIAPPKTNGWQESDLTFEQLGDRVGQTMKSLKGVVGIASLILDNGELSGRVTNTYKIRSGQEFAIEYNLPTDPTKTGRLMANPASGKAMLEAGTWKKIPSGGNANLVETWSLNFPREIFDGLVTGQDSWKPLFAELAQGKGGFKSTIEMRQVVPKDGGPPQKYYRVLATRTTPRAEEIEARFDAQHFLPLAIRVKTIRKNGAKLETQWQARWSWSEPMKDEDFKFPRVM
ncbi:MAG: hypothetical protein K1X67_15735 [Fimbriimonadaceae bacterium]|nr:hypothetical protein [Fimbriimonadaceae bacterium]